MQFKFREKIIRSNFLKWQKDLKGQNEWARPAEDKTDMICKASVTNWLAQGPDVDGRKVVLGSYNVLKMPEFICQVVWSPMPY